MTVKRAVIDTNVLISAALSAHTPPAAVTRWVLEQGRLVFSESTFAELESRLWRPKFDRYLTIEQRRRLLHDLNAVAEWVTIAGLTERHSRDIDDDKFVHTALAGAAALLVSGDRDLLDLGTVGPVAMLSPRDVLKQMQDLPLV